ncbi:MAG: bifunctional riboflavin kinase/FAD synthetase [Sphingomonadaceae bacterium]
MQIIEGGGELPAALRGGALALGNFDGVHLGHQAVIGAALTHARASGLPGLVATFEPHPSRHFRPDSPPFAITTLSQKLRLVDGLGADGVIVIPFDSALAGLSAEQFAADWLARRLGVAHVVTGHDFTFGRGRSGSAEQLPILGRLHGFTAEAVAPVADSRGVVSSTRVRSALEAGDMALATALLGRPFAIEMPVVHGDKRGRTIGVPTANQLLGPYQRPRYGVYASRVRLPGGDCRPAVSNLGVRPMFDPPRELLETWIPDWKGDLYGEIITVELIGWLRAELALDGLEALKAQIGRDWDDARALLGAGDD